MWQGPVVEIFSPQAGHGEARIIAIGMLADRCITVIYTWRGDKAALD
nr:BrnT family toxin [Nitrosococcus oceani]